MIAVRRWWLVLATLFGIRVIVRAEVDWVWLKERLIDSVESQLVVAKGIVENWNQRPKDFFQNIPEVAWNVLTPLLSSKDFESIRQDELENNSVACKVFAKYLSKMVNTKDLPDDFRSSVYKLLSEGGRGDGNTLQFPGLVESIPASWAEKDGPEIMKMLAPPSSLQFGRLHASTLDTLLKDPGACRFLTFEALKSLNKRGRKRMTSNCLAAIKDLDSMDLSEMLVDFSHDIFAHYNGALSKKTIEWLSGSQLRAYGSKIDKNLPICLNLNLHHFSNKVYSSAWASARCLHGYLSQKPGEQLGRGWIYVDRMVIEDFTLEMKSVWVNIHPKDYTWMHPGIRKVILSAPNVCSAFKVSDLSEEILTNAPHYCLYAILIKSGGNIELGKLWNFIQGHTLKDFTDKMMAMAIKNVALSDFIHMGTSILQVIFNSDVALANLPQPVQDIIISPLLKLHRLDPERFAAIAKVAPNLAGQILVKVYPLNVNVLDECDGNVIRTLTFIVPGEEKLDWKSLFRRLERKDSYILSHIKSKPKNSSRRHFCSTIQDFEEYLSLDWLRHQMVDECRSELTLDLSSPTLLLQAPELTFNSVPWERMLESYSPKNWATISANKNFASVLGRQEDFWATLNHSRHDVLLAMDSEALKRIIPRCVVELAGALHSYPWLAPFLSDFAFFEYRITKLPCDLRFLSPGQISELSCGSFSSIEELVAEVQYDEFVSQLKALNEKQHKALEYSCCQSFLSHFHYEFSEQEQDEIAHRLNTVFEFGLDD